MQQNEPRSKRCILGLKSIDFIMVFRDDFSLMQLNEPRSKRCIYALKDIDFISIFRDTLRLLQNFTKKFHPTEKDRFTKRSILARLKNKPKQDDKRNIRV